jgi:hypothetical protein
MLQRREDYTMSLTWEYTETEAGEACEAQGHSRRFVIEDHGPAGNDLGGRFCLTFTTANGPHDVHVDYFRSLYQCKGFASAVNDCDIAQASADVLDPANWDGRPVVCRNTVHVAFPVDSGLVTAPHGDPLH